jgi:hypothetical protein
MAHAEPEGQGRESRPIESSEDTIYRPPETLPAARLIAAARPPEVRQRQRAELQDVLPWLGEFDYDNSPARLLAEQTEQTDLPLYRLLDYADQELRLEVEAYLLWRKISPKEADAVAQEAILWLFTGTIEQRESPPSQSDQAPDDEDIQHASVLRTPVVRQALEIGRERRLHGQELNATVANEVFRAGWNALIGRAVASRDKQEGQSAEADAGPPAAAELAAHLHTALRPRLEGDAQKRGLNAQDARHLAQDTLLRLLGDVEIVGSIKMDGEPAGVEED